MPHRWFLTALLVALPLVADDEALVRVTDPWRWVPGRTEPSEPPAAWRLVGFDDSAWRSGPAGFALNYYDYEATVISPAAVDYDSVYLRRTFELEQPDLIAWLILRVDYGGGFIAYLNGEEIVRRGLPGEPGSWTPRTAVPEPHYRGVPEYVDLSAAKRWLRPGRNTLAIQWHFLPGTTYGAVLVPELLANFIRGPFVQATGPDRQTIVWRTLQPADTTVEFGPTSALGEQAADPALVTTHVVTLADLQADTLYFYRVRSTAGGETAVSPTRTFRTFKPAGPVSFVVVGDMGLGTTNQYRVAQVMRQAQPDLVCVVGDLVYPAFTANRDDLRFFSVYGAQMRGTPFYPAAGNHDVLYGASEKDFFADFYMPTNSVDPAVHLTAQTSPKHYYSFDAGDAHFAALFAPLMQGRLALTNGSPQMLWLEADLAASRKPWKFLYCHIPLASSGWHRDDDYNYNQVYDPLEMAAVLLPVAHRHGVQLIFSGHEHVYERFNPMNGVFHVITGGGGGGLYGLLELDVADAQFWPRYECVKVTVAGDLLTLEALGEDGLPFDRMFIQRAPPPPQVFPAAWNSPRIETEPANDRDGNLTGQTFNLIGQPIPTLPGDFSNLGRLYVNYDAAVLYLGFEQAMIYADNNIFLFLEGPGRAGVTSLAGLGNGLVDPGEQGADGLDFLENLAFVNFAPSIGCLLGDEFADGQYRSFPRTNTVLVSTPLGYVPVVQTNLALNIGQGVFHLDAAFSDVPGVRLQQFNRSPQAGAQAGEQNANFIELAIPLAELGARVGDRIRIGAVVGGGQFSTNPAEQSRLLDRSYLGRRLTGDGMGPHTLEPIEVQLGSAADEDDDGLPTELELLLGTDPHKADTDGDGLPDGWEVGFHLDPLEPTGLNGAHGDPDGDGFENLAEWLAGTDPRNPASALRLELRLVAGGRFQLEWQAVPGKRYQLQAADSLRAGFSDLAAPGFPRLATTARETFEDSINPVAPSRGRYYRMRLVP